MKVYIGLEDPLIYSLSQEKYSGFDKEVEMSHDLYIKFSKTIGYWNEMQDYLHDLYDKTPRTP